jgi:hypothetical protein
MAGRLTVDFEAWDDHASWWENESEAARRRMSIDDDTLESARHSFGKIGSSTVGEAYAATLAARRELGERLGGCAQSVATHIRRDLQTYADQEEDGHRMLRS